MCSAESVPFFGPPLPCFGEFNDHISFRDFLLAKCKWWGVCVCCVLCEGKCECVCGECVSEVCLCVGGGDI